ncbi:hypothetical protein B7C48_00020, partial [Streptococcus pyogenes]|uniref:hypothetical protein n=1 Tax=Streptococcus pyogenes TaxID=1314 RepID=UPI000A1EDBEC
MIHTKQPANSFMVYLSAFRNERSEYENNKKHSNLVSWLQSQAFDRGNDFKVVSASLTGSYRKRGQAVTSVERTIQVQVSDWAFVEVIAKHAHLWYQQEAVMVVATQTHS